MRENERAMEATQKIKNKKRRKEKKKREGAALLSFLNPHLCFKVALVLQFVESFLSTSCF